MGGKIVPPSRGAGLVPKQRRAIFGDHLASGDDRTRVRSARRTLQAGCGVPWRRGLRVIVAPFRGARRRGPDAVVGPNGPETANRAGGTPPPWPHGVGPRGLRAAGLWRQRCTEASNTGWAIGPQPGCSGSPPNGSRQPRAVVGRPVISHPGRSTPCQADSTSARAGPVAGQSAGLGGPGRHACHRRRGSPRQAPAVHGPGLPRPTAAPGGARPRAIAGRRARRPRTAARYRLPGSAARMHWRIVALPVRHDRLGDEACWARGSRHARTRGRPGLSGSDRGCRCGEPWRRS